jgi:hypothetical protein
MRDRDTSTQNPCGSSFRRDPVKVAFNWRFDFAFGDNGAEVEPGRIRGLDLGRNHRLHRPTGRFEKMSV